MTNAWQPIGTAPKEHDRKVDLWAKYWHAATDTFEWQRFPDCVWWKSDSMGSWDAHWHGLPKGWHPTHWMDPPAPPESDNQ